ncbi:MAG: hypothetical protein PHW03_09725 [Eubacteriales bacterium]|nr:hypothetical protein [Eubacteriales bacterium]
MSREEVYGIIETLANGQGFYARLLNRLNAVDKDVSNEFLDSFADCKDMIDVIMVIEG